MRLIIAFFTVLFLMNEMPDMPEEPGSEGSAENADPLFSFGIVTDVHYCNCEPAGTRFYRQSLDKLAEAVTGLAKDNPRFIVSLGDLIEKDYESYKPVQEIFTNSGVKIHYVAGNHDYSVEDRFRKRIPPIQQGKNGYYSFTESGFRFIILNGNEISTYSSSNKKAVAAAADLIAGMKNNGEINAMDWNGGMSANQLLWLDDQLTMAATDNQKVFIFCHFPVTPENEHNMLNHRDLLKVLEKHGNIIAWFNGHNHAGNYGNLNMTHFVTLRAMVETQDNNSYSLVEVYTNKIWIKGAGREKSQILAY